MDEEEHSIVRLSLASHLTLHVASKGEVCTYSDISRYLKLQFDLEEEPMSISLAGLLGDISVEENKQENPLLSVVVVNKETKIPGDGFFKLAKDLGLYDGSLINREQKDAFYISELNKAHSFWGRDYDPEWSEYLRLKKKFEGR
ncbi:hypothetical protein [Paenibacillus sp. OK060]|uniref:hypothetical protein n=1 Tax=Paenibacillus sp. OK060 TaxID=1881034 RepID=UPI00115F99AC|nr:hypothetical protein [Paenibacillus sp. OK060]